MRSDAEIIVITWGPYHDNFESFAEIVGYILKLFCAVLPVGYSEVMFLCMSFLVASSLGPRPAIYLWPSFPSFAESWAGPGNEASPALPYCKRRKAG